MHILIIEDERNVASFLKKGFQSEAFSVDCAHDGPGGLRLAETGSYDAIILDLMLPGMDGLTLLEKLRASRVQTPVLILTARGDVEDRVRGLNTGRTTTSQTVLLLRGPCPRQSSPASLVAHLRGSVLEAGDVRMDLVSHSVTRGGKPLCSRIRNSSFWSTFSATGAVVSRVTLTEHIWDMDFDSEKNVVDVLVNRLRRKSDDGPPGKNHQYRPRGRVRSQGAFDGDPS